MVLAYRYGRLQLLWPNVNDVLNAGKVMCDLHPPQAFIVPLSMSVQNSFIQELQEANIHQAIIIAQKKTFKQRRGVTVSSRVHGPS